MAQLLSSHATPLSNPITTPMAKKMIAFNYRQPFGLIGSQGLTHSTGAGSQTNVNVPWRTVWGKMGR